MNQCRYFFETQSENINLGLHTGQMKNSGATFDELTKKPLFSTTLAKG